MRQSCSFRYSILLGCFAFLTFCFSGIAIDEHRCSSVRHFYRENKGCLVMSSVDSSSFSGFVVYTVPKKKNSLKPCCSSFSQRNRLRRRQGHETWTLLVSSASVCTPKNMPVCTNCAAYVECIYTKYSENNIRLEQCVCCFYDSRLKPNGFVSRECATHSRTDTSRRML